MDNDNYLPFISRIASDKWDSLQDKGYWEEKRTEEGIYFTYGDYPTMGFIDWWGKVIWKRDD